MTVNPLLLKAIELQTGGCSRYGPEDVDAKLSDGYGVRLDGDNPAALPKGY